MNSATIIEIKERVALIRSWYEGHSDEAVLEELASQWINCQRELEEMKKQRDELKAELSVLLPEGPSEMTPEEVKEQASQLVASATRLSRKELSSVLLWDLGVARTVREFLQTTETLIATQCTLNRVLNELAALQRANQERKEKP